MSLTIPFEQPNSPSKYEIALDIQRAAEGDGVLLVGNREALRALASVLEQLADEATPDGTHVHIGYTEEEPQGPGWRITVHSSGRVSISGAA